MTYDVELNCRYFDIGDIMGALQSALGVDGLSSDDLFDHFYAYECDGEYYILPGVEKAIAPSAVKYIRKSHRS